jgi:EAL domain-containing protein (putative c-di-GMP-specific phosphodiesterase class I)
MPDQKGIMFPDGVRQVTCKDCIDGQFNIPISMAFQPIVNTATKRVYAYEALVRGIAGEPALSVLSQINTDNRYFFDQAARVTAIRLASKLGLPSGDQDTKLSINFMPNAVYRASTCIRATLEAARLYHLDPRRLIFEIAEADQIVDRKHLMGIIEVYRTEGFTIALDDFGEGYAGLNHLIEIRPDVIKLDLNLIRNIDHDAGRQAVVRATVSMCKELGIGVVAEGVETLEEWSCLEDLGVFLHQGYLFSRPAFEALPEPQYPN